MEYILLLATVIVFTLITSFKKVPNATAFVIERFAHYHRTVSSRIIFLIPLIDSVRAQIDLREQTMDTQPQTVTTKDNVAVRIDVVIFYQITDPKKAIYEVQNVRSSIIYLLTTTLRDIVGNIDYANMFSSRTQINTQLCQILGKEVGRWGCKVNNVKIKDIDLKEIEPSEGEVKLPNEREVLKDLENAVTKEIGEKQYMSEYKECNDDNNLEEKKTKAEEQEHSAITEYK